MADPIAPVLARRQVAFVVSLTPLQTSILQWLADGKHTEEVSALIGISQNAVEVNLYRAMNKMGTATRCGAVSFAIRRGLIK